jgi:hypothetical protein
MGGDRALLLDQEGGIAHEWRPPGMRLGYAQLLPGGHALLRGHVEPLPHGTVPAGGGNTIVELDWEGREVWRWGHPNAHHDMYRMSNGNTLVLVNYPLPDAFARRIQGGFRRQGSSETILGEAIWEVTPDGEKVNEWLSHEHLDPEVDVICPLETRAEWLHANAVEMTPDGNVLISARRTDWVTCITWPEGEVLWRYGKGVLSHQHDPTITPSGTLLVFDNGTHHPGMPRTSVVEVHLDTWQVVWRYRGGLSGSFYSGFISGCQRLPGGNTLVCEGDGGRVFEVTPDHDICWEWVSPYVYPHRDWPRSTLLFRAHRYYREDEVLAGFL